MLTWKERVLAFFGWLWEAWGDPKNKNRVVLVLLVLCAFGMVAPDRATSMRDFVAAMLF